MGDRGYRMQEFQRILIIKPSSLGDIIHSLPVLHSLRIRFPKAHLGWFIHERWANILSGHPDLNEIIPWSFRWSGLPRLLKVFRGKKFDLAVDLQGLFRSGVISYLSGAKVRVGFKNGREGSTLFYTHPVAVPINPMHALDRYLLVAKSLGAAQTEPVCIIPISREDEQTVNQLLKNIGLLDTQHFVAVSPTARWWTKRWPIDRFAQLTDLIQDSGFPVVLFGGESDIPEIQRLQALTRTSPLSVAGQTTLKQLAAFLKRSSLLITNDSGPMHLAAAVGTPVVALFGPTDPVRTGPYPHLSPLIMHTIIRKPVECSPCLSKRCRVGDHRCMATIDVTEVFERSRKILSQMKEVYNVH